MSKYTTEVRYICEVNAGLEESGGVSDVDTIISNSWNKIFTSNVPFFDENYRRVLCSKILKHYYLREICCETVATWKLWMNERLEMIMPYYNQLYESAKLEFDPLKDVDLVRKQDRTTTGETKDTETATRNTSGETDNTETSTGKTETSGSSNETKRDLYSDTPQGAITGLENENYLTNARKITDGLTNSSSEGVETNRKTGGNYSEQTDNNVTKNGTANTVDDYLEMINGKQGGATYSEMLMEYRDTFLNIDLQVVNEFEDLFFGLW